MHELSIVMGIIDVVNNHLPDREKDEVESVELEIGKLATIDLLSFDFAWNQAVKGTPLANAERKIFSPPGKGKCLDCDTEFDLQNLYDACPKCNSYFVNVISGKELRVKSLTLK